jgi:hypothetical protein
LQKERIIFSNVNNTSRDDDLSEIYGRPFFTEYGTSNPIYARCCAIVAEEIARRFSPKTAVDWGCGAGIHVAALQKRGVAALGVDGVVCPHDLRAAGIEVLQADLRKPISDKRIPSNYDLSLCLDVLEHVSENDMQQAIENITCGAKLLLLSCAPPGQGGHHHVNEQPRRFWVARLASIGWKYDRKATGALENILLSRRPELVLSWTYHNLCVYRTCQ